MALGDVDFTQPDTEVAPEGHDHTGSAVLRFPPATQ